MYNRRPEMERTLTDILKYIVERLAFLRSTYIDVYIALSFSNHITLRIDRVHFEVAGFLMAISCKA